MTVTEIRALDKTLRDGRHLTIDLVPQNGCRFSYWMRATLDGAIVYDRFYASVARNSSPLPGLPHTITIRLEEPDPHRPGWTHLVNRPIGLTDDEADRIDWACKEWWGRHARHALEAAPDAATWTLRGRTSPPLVGAATRDDNDDFAMVLAVRKRWIPEDGRSFGLDDEDGYVYDVTVRALLPDEVGQARADEDYVLGLVEEQAARWRVAAPWRTP